MNGIIVINKPPQKTSHDMVGFVRKLTGIKKVGHTGTLDPMATGVLPICIGKATKAADMLTDSDKAYRTKMVLGATTDTQDASGKVLKTSVVSVTEEQIKEAVYSFIGEISQIPPMFSAIKKDGKKLYELARQGISIEREPRRVKIYDIKITETDLENHTVTLDVACSKGTYIRTLCDDIGKKLGCGAYMSELIRTKSAGFGISESYKAEELEKMKEQGTLESALLPLDSIFKGYDRIELDDKQAKKVKNGVRIKIDNKKSGDLYRVYDKNGAFLSISECKNGELILKKAFWVD